MEVDSADEESSDSIPRPRYEALGVDSRNSTPTFEMPTAEVQLLGKRLKFSSGAQLTVNGAPIMAANVDSSETPSEVMQTVAPLTMKIVTGKGSLSKVAAATTTKPKEHKLKMVFVSDQHGTLEARTVSRETAVNSSTPVKVMAAPLHVVDEVTPIHAPLSREFIALQKSLNDSKVLSEYVTEAGKLSRRKSRATVTPPSSVRQANSTTPASVPKITIKRRRTARLSVDKVAKSAKQRSKSVSGILFNFYPEDTRVTMFSRKTKKKRVHSLSADISLSDATRFGGIGDTLHQFDVPHQGKYKERLLPLERSKSSKSPTSRNWLPDERAPKRSNMRSENRDFVQKQAEFLNRIINDPVDDVIDSAALISVENQEELTNAHNVNISLNMDVSNFLDSLTSNSAMQSNNSGNSSSLNLLDEDSDRLEKKLYELWLPPPKDGWDPFCWKCYRCGDLVACSKCLRSFHLSCIKTGGSGRYDLNWSCAECLLVESTPKRSRRSNISTELLNQLLNHALKRMRLVKGITKLLVPQEVLPLSYKKYFVNPVTFATLDQKIRNGVFRSADEFVCETKWMYHNAQIMSLGFNSSKHAHTEKVILKVCRQEANEIDTCAECYLNANTNQNDWFVQVCSQPHLLLWAKLKGFPYWPAKAMGHGPGAVVNVRFFGKHDRANVPVKDCFLYSAQDPNSQTSRRSARDLADCIDEVQIHIENIKAKIGDFCYAPFRTPYEPNEEHQQLEQMMPGVYDFIKVQHSPANKTPLQFLIRKTEGNNHSILKKSSATADSGNDSDQSNSPSKRKQHLESNDQLASLKCQPSLQHEHSKLKSSNYEVITKLPHDETRVCSVILKRKSLADLNNELRKASKNESEFQDSSPTVSSKRKHTDNISIEGGQHKAKQQRRDSKRDDTRDHSKAPKVSEHSARGLDSLQQLKNKHGVTITKLTKEPQPDQCPEHEHATNAEQDAVELKNDACRVDDTNKIQQEKKQQELIRKVMPFIEIKTEPDDSIEGMSIRTPTSTPLTISPLNTSNPNSTSSSSTKSHSSPSIETPVTKSIDQKTPDLLPLELPDVDDIKEEIISDDELEEYNAINQKNTGLMSNKIVAVQQPPSANTIIPMDALVRVVGDTTIQRLSTKQQHKQQSNIVSNQHTLPPNNSKRSNVSRGTPYGPLPANASSVVPVKTTDTNANIDCVNVNKSSHQQSQQLQTLTQQQQQQHKQAQQQQSNQQQLRLKTNSSLVESTTTRSASSMSTSTSTTTTNPNSLLKNNMVVIPADGGSQQQTRNNTPNSSITISAAGCNSLIPVPPLTAVSKHAAQSLNSQSSSNLAPSLNAPVNSMPLPPLAGLSMPPTVPTASTVCGTLITPPSIAPPIAPPLATLVGSVVTSNGGGPVTESNQTEDRVTPVLNATLNDILHRGPPKLWPRPQGPLQSDGSAPYPSQAGPVSQKLAENAHKLTDFFISVMVDTMSEMATTDPKVLQARITSLSLENERIKQTYERQIADMIRTNEQIIAELRKSLENDYKRRINEIRQQHEQERSRSVEEAKSKQWCANCGREAYMYCCWNTSYCHTNCQLEHWPRHSIYCGNETVKSQLQTQQQQQQQVQQTLSMPQQPQQAEKVRNKPKVQTQMPAQVAVSAVVSAPTMIAVTASTNKPNNITTIANNSVNKKWTQSPHQQQSAQTIVTQMHGQHSEVLKLPSNTYLRPVSMASTTATAISAGNTLQSGSQHPQTANVRPISNPTSVTSMSMQRYNICPIAINTTGQAITFVQSMNSGNSNGANQPTLAPMSNSAHLASATAASAVTTQQSQISMKNHGLRNYATKSAGRPRGSHNKKHQYNQ